MDYCFDRITDLERASLYAKTSQESKVLSAQPYVYHNKATGIFSIKFLYLIDLARVAVLKPKTLVDKAHLKGLFDRTKSLRDLWRQKTYSGAHDYTQYLNPQAGITLKPFQQIGCNFIYDAKQCILADDASLEKNLQAILALCRMNTERIIKNSIMIVASKANKKQWEDDLRKYINFKINPELKDITIVDGSTSTKFKRYQKKSKIYILNHEQFPYDRVHIEPLSKRIDALIVDDAAKMKGSSSKRACDITQFFEKTPIKVFLTDATIGQNLMDLYILRELMKLIVEMETNTPTIGKMV